MLRLEEVKAVVEAAIPALKLGNAGEFAKIMESGQLPQFHLGGWILPGRLQGGALQAMSGAFIQDFNETVSIVLVTRNMGDATGARAMDELTPLIRQVVGAVCGHSPADAPGVFILVGGEFVGSQGGALLYHLDFALSDQLRILS